MGRSGTPTRASSRRSLTPSRLGVTDDWGVGAASAWTSTPAKPNRSPASPASASRREAANGKKPLAKHDAASTTPLLAPVVNWLANHRLAISSVPSSWHDAANASPLYKASCLSYGVCGAYLVLFGHAAHGQPFLARGEVVVWLVQSD